MKRWLGIGAFVFAGCCTQALSVSAIGFTLSQEAAEALVAGPAVLRLCVGNDCRESGIDAADAGTPAFGAPAYDESTRLLTMRQLAEPGATADVTLSASRDGNELFTRTWSDVGFSHHTPNGPLCDGDSYAPKENPLKF